MKQLALLQELESPAVHGAICTEAEACLAGLQVEIAHGISHVYVETLCCWSQPLNHQTMCGDFTLAV